MQLIKKQPKYAVWGACLFTLYVGIALLFKPSNTDISDIGIVWGAIATIAILVISYAVFVLWWKARETGFSLLANADGKSRLGGLKNLFTRSGSDGKEDGLIKTWWNNLDKESSPGKQFVTLVMALLFAYIEFSIRGSVWSALFLILFAAIIVPPKSKITKAFVYLDLVIITTAAFFPGAAEMRKASYSIADVWTRQKGAEMRKYADRLEKGGPAEEATKAPSAQPSSRQTASHAQEFKQFDLTSSIIGPFRPLPTGGNLELVCTGQEAEMMVEFSSAKSTQVKSGEWFMCPTVENPAYLGDMYVNLSMYFRSENGGKLYIRGVQG